jgi:hypothetical protein
VDSLLGSHDLFGVLDVDGSGRISWHEFLALVPLLVGATPLGELPVARPRMALSAPTSSRSRSASASGCESFAEWSAARSSRAAVGSKPGSLDSWVGKLAGRRASDVLEGGWKWCGPVVQAIGCR